jgi:hypothetical protein
MVDGKKMEPRHLGCYKDRAGFGHLKDHVARAVVAGTNSFARLAPLSETIADFL